MFDDAPTVRAMTQHQRPEGSVTSRSMVDAGVHHAALAHEDAVLDADVFTDIRDRTLTMRSDDEEVEDYEEKPRAENEWFAGPFNLQHKLLYGTDVNNESDL
jgi:hypothetical protein